MSADSQAASFDTIVIGGGPAGATAATLLARHGRRVVVLEKDRFPRYRVGESLLPFCYGTLERLGLLKAMVRSPFTKKWSVQFVSTSGKLSTPFYFYKHMKHHSARTWQVERSEFDQLLLDTARQSGAEVHEETRVRELITEGDQVVGVRAVGPGGEPLEFRAPITIDASGRDAVAMKQYGWRLGDPVLNKVAIWTYYRGAKRDEGLDSGATTVAYIPSKGWFWYIPLQDDRVSVGVVADKDTLYAEGRDPETIFHREAAKNSWLAEHLAAGECEGHFRVTGDYSYRAKHCAANGLVLTGDALAFLDPVFSSGVFLALKSGELAADTVHAALADGDVSAGRFEAYSGEILGHVEAMRKLVYAFYDEGFNFGEMLREYPHLRQDLTDCLIGNLERDFTELWTAVAEFASLPEEIPAGLPLTSGLSGGAAALAGDASA